MPRLKKTISLFLATMAAGLVLPFWTNASDQVSYPGIDIQMYLDFTKTGQFWDFTRGNSTTINPGDALYIRQNTTFSQPIRGTFGGMQNGTSVVHWVASNCLPGASCIQQIYREPGNPLAFPWWTVVLGATYTGPGSAYFRIQTSEATPPGVYTINFLAEENPVTWPEPLMNPARQTFTITVRPDIRPEIAASPATAVFQGVSGGAAPASQPVVLKNSGEGVLNWSGTADSDWCRISPASGSLAANQSVTLNLSVDRPSRVGSFNCVVSLSDPAARNSPKNLFVTYQVSSAPQAGLALSPTSLAFSAYSNESGLLPKSAVVRNTGSATLNFRASTNRPWCRVAPSAGSVPPGGSQSLQVSVDDPSNVGSFDCRLEVSDPAASNSPKNLLVSYQVSQFVGDPSVLTASPKPCEAVTLAWRPAANASQYNLYRNTRNSLPGSAIVAGYEGLGYIDTNVQAGIRYYYWVETLGGTLSTKVPAAANSAGGVLVQACIAEEVPVQPPVVAASGRACETADLQWSNVANEQGYYVYRNTSGIGPASQDRVASLGQNITSLSERLPAGSYHYWVSSYNQSGESPKMPASPRPVLLVACDADLSASDKNLISINGQPQERSVCDYDRFQGLPAAKTVLQPGDRLVYEINLCNAAARQDAKEVVVLDNLTNLDAPEGGLNVRLDGQVMGLAAGSQPKAGEYYFDSAAKKIYANIGKIKKQSQARLTYEVVVKTQAGYSSICPRCQNQVTVTYGKNDSDRASLDLHSPQIFYSVKPNSVSN